MSGTRETILLTALRLFSVEGYEAVSVSRIAGAMGMTKGALYKHYRSKQDIFDRIIARMEQLDREHAGMYDLPEGTLEEMAKEYQNASIERIIGFSKEQFQFWTREEFASCFRKMLTLEQYRDQKMGALYQQYFVSGPLGYVTDLFQSLDIPDARNMAVAFYGPMYMLYSYYDGADDKADAAFLLDDHFEKMRRVLTGRGETEGTLIPLPD